MSRKEACNIQTSLKWYPLSHDQFLGTEPISTVLDHGKPFVRAIFDELYASTGEHAPYREFVKRFGPQVAETAIRLYRQNLKAMEG